MGPGAVDTASVVLWWRVSQRLKRSATLQVAVKHLVESAGEWYADSQRLREQSLSSGTAAYSGGRQRLTREVTEWFANEVSDSIIATAPLTTIGTASGDRRVFVVDGTTITLAPEQGLQAAFPPTSNPQSEDVWPVVALLVVAHELESGCAMQPEVGARYGPNAVAETQLALACFARWSAHSVALADANFGIFSVAHGAARCGHSFLFRLTEPWESTERSGDPRVSHLLRLLEFEPEDPAMGATPATLSVRVCESARPAAPGRSLRWLNVEAE